MKRRRRRRREHTRRVNTTQENGGIERSSDAARALLARGSAGPAMENPACPRKHTKPTVSARRKRANRWHRHKREVIPTLRHDSTPAPLDVVLKTSEPLVGGQRVRTVKLSHAGPANTWSAASPRVQKHNHYLF